jgi:hypothetical protein
MSNYYIQGIWRLPFGIYVLSQSGRPSSLFTINIKGVNQ